MTYGVPVGQQWLTGVVIYSGDPKAYVPLLVRIWGDGKLLWEHGMRGDGPPVVFSVPVIPTTKVVIESESTWITTYYLADAQFTSSEYLSPGYVPAANTGYVDASPLSRQEVLGIYHPGENVSVAAYYSGSASHAVVDIHVRPTWPAGAPLIATRLDIPLGATTRGLVEGRGIWKVPSDQGVAMLHIKESVEGRVVFERQTRIAIGPRVDLSSEPDSYWGVHLSGAGYAAIFDQFAGLWGAKWGRIFLRWPVVESVQGTLDFSRIDQLVQIYRSQGMRILMVIGENAPPWAGPPGSLYYNSWKKFVNAAVDRLAGKVDAWEIFNEIDAKYYDALGTFEADWDLTVMRIAIEALRNYDPKLPTVCCSTVTPSWLSYDRRIFREGLLTDIDILSLHPYQHNAPEQKEGEFNYTSRLVSLGNLERAFGPSKPIWATEANWIIGRTGDQSVPEPDMSEQDQAEYVVRANLLSAASDVKFFLHSPYAHANRTEIHLSTWAAYAQMASFFSGTSKLNLAKNGPQVFAVAAQSSTGDLGALWTAYGQTNVRLNCSEECRFFDMYGNPVSMDPHSIGISSSPLYYVSSHPIHIQLSSVPHARAWKTLGGLSSWICASNASCTSVATGRHVQSQPSTGAFQLVSPVNHDHSGACHVAHIQLSVEEGTIGLYAVDATDIKRISPVVLVSGGDRLLHKVELRFNTGNSVGFKLVLANGNARSTVTTFTVWDPAEISDCW